MLGNTRRLAIKSSSISEAPAQSTPATGKKAATTAKVTMILRMVFQITPGFQWLLAGLPQGRSYETKGDQAIGPGDDLRCWFSDLRNLPGRSAFRFKDLVGAEPKTRDG